MSRGESAFDPDCDFCRIAAGVESAELVAEGTDWLAFFPLNPATRGHTLVIPRKHVASLWGPKSRALESDLMHACVSLGRAICGALQPDGMNLITSAGEAAEQTVHHLHLHLVPRWDDDNFGQIWPTRERSDDNQNLKALAADINANFKEELA